MNKENDIKNKLTKLPEPPEGSDEAIAYDLIATVLNQMLNRHVHELEKHGYLNKKKYHKEAGWLSSNPQKTLQIKFDLMDEAQEKFTPYFIEVLKNYKGEKVGLTNHFI